MTDLGVGMALSVDHMRAGAGTEVTLPDKAEEASQAFEAMFVNEIFKIMRRTTPSTQKDFGGRMFSEMFDEQISKHVAEAGLGMQGILQGALGKKNAQDEATSVDRSEHSPFGSR